MQASRGRARRWRACPTHLHALPIDDFMSAIILQDEIVHYEVLGRGRPIIFLHGWVGSWRYWIPAMQAASISFRAYALDLWGFGDTGKNPDRYGLAGQVALLNQFLEEMGIGKIAVIGHGLGAVVGMLFALHNPDTVDRILAISLPESPALLHPRLSASSPVELADWLLDHNPISEATRSEAPKSDPLAIKISMSELANLDLAGLRSRLQTPCLLVYGGNDPAISAPSAEQVIYFPEHFHQIVFDESGHFPMLEEGSKFNRLMADFLALSSGESPRQLQLKEEWRRRVR